MGAPKKDFEGGFEKVLMQCGERACSLHGFDLIEMEVHKGKGRWILRYFIDREGGITVEDCAQVSSTVSSLLDAKDPIEAPYTLEVSSPGIERPLRREEDFVKYSGKEVKIRTEHAVFGRKNYFGVLLGVRDGSVLINDEEGGEVSIALNNIKKARLKYFSRTV